MFKAILVIFVIGIGRGADESGGSISVTPFQSMEQCKEAIEHIDSTTNAWHYGDAKNDVVPVRKSYNCYPITPVAVTAEAPAARCPNPAPVTPTIPEVEEEVIFRPLRKHKRWDQ